VLLQRLDDISEAYLQGLCSDGTMESQTLDFKLELSKADDKRELHKDLCAFANADGGDLVYGIAQDAGTAAKIVPVNTASVDALRRRIAQAVDGIEPRLQGVRVHEVSVPDGHVVIVRVPASFDGPHSFRVDGGARRFVLRNGTDTTEMNFDQIRTAFDRTASLAERARELIDQRFQAIAQRHTWKPFHPGTIASVALVPIAGLAGRNAVNIAAINNSYNRFMFPEWSSVSRTMNLDGLVVYPATPKEGQLLAYTQVYRNGTIVGLRTAAALATDRPLIPSTVVTAFYRDAAIKFIHASKALDFTGPAVLRCAMTNVAGYQFGIGAMGDPWAKTVADVDRDFLMLPDVWIDSLEAIETAADADALLLPILDVLWQAFDLERCEEYDLSGKWSPRTL
jgi:hypothetical protein